MVGFAGLPPLEGRPTSELIAERLRQRIIDGSFLPGEQMLESQVAAQLDVSRGPVREALHRLCQEGLLVSHRNRGVFVLELTRQDVVEVYSAREAIELAAVRAILGRGWATLAGPAVKRLSDVVAQMPAAARSGDWRSLTALDLRFHTVLVESAGNSRLSRIYTTLAAEAQMSMFALEISAARVMVLVEEHLEILRLLSERDLPAIEQAITQHLSLDKTEVRLTPTA
jgi:DNA-binding GntR family transcriptional regulator